MQCYHTAADMLPEYSGHAIMLHVLCSPTVHWVHAWGGVGGGRRLLPVVERLCPCVQPFQAVPAAKTARSRPGDVLTRLQC